MSSSKPPPPEEPAPPEKSDADKKSGRVGFDSRGNPIWEWQIKTGIFGRDIDTKRMKKLEAPDLKIADDPPPAAGKAGKQSAPPRQPGGGMDPYNSGGAKPVKNPVVDQVTGAKPATKPQPKSENRITDWLPFRKKP